MGRDSDLSLGERAAIARMERALFGREAEAVRLGRYEIVRTLGSGAFGRVYEARDPQLGRTVAVKLLPDALPGRIEEARVMATVAHPHVAHVYDAGVVGTGDDACAFIAMELVTGKTLREWAAEERRSLTDVLDVMRQAGRGLAAAHAAGVVHRDFKPDNVLVGADGRVRVVDFGLARAPGEAEADAAAAPSGAETDPLRTATGVLLGTPAYMAPEQHQGRAADAQSDQFAFAVTLWELLQGERPFGGGTVKELADEVQAGRTRAWRRGPAWLQRAVRRGLATAPADRFLSVTQLLTALDRGPARWPRWVGAGVGAAILIGVGALLATTRGPAATLCRGDEAAMLAVWNAAREARVAAAFRATGRPFAEDAWKRVKPALDRYRDGWLAARLDACEATHLRQEQSTARLDRRLGCLDAARRQLAALIDVLEGADAVVVQSSISAVHDLPSLAACADPPEEDAARPEAARPLYEELERARARHTAGRPAQALEIAEQVQARADELPYAPLQAAAAIWQAESLMTLGRQAEAVAAARRGFDLALAGSDERSALYAATVLAFAGAFDASKKEESLKWVRTGESLAKRLPAEVELAAKLANAEGNIHLTAGDAKAAREPFERTVAAFTRLDADHPNLGSTVAMLGIAALQLGDAAGAAEKLADALARVERTLGPEHPEVASTLVNLSLAQSALGRYEAAESSVRRALGLHLRLLGKDHPLLAYTHLTLGLLLGTRGKVVEAEASLREAERVAQDRFGSAHPLTGQTMLATAELLARAGRAREATEHAERGRAILVAAFGEDAPETFLAEATLSQAYRAARRLDEALAHGRRAVQLVGARTIEGAAIAHQQLGEALLARGRRAEGATALAEAERILHSAMPDPHRLAEVRFARARALGDRDQAAQTLAEYPADADPTLRGTMQTWLAGR